MPDPGWRLDPREQISAAFDWVRGAYRPWPLPYALLAKRRVVNVLNSQSSSGSNRGRAYVQAKGPKWLASRLALFAVKADPLCPADWLTLRLTEPQRCGRWTWRWQVTYRRCS